MLFSDYKLISYRKINKIFIVAFLQLVEFITVNISFPGWELILTEIIINCFKHSIFI